MTKGNGSYTAVPTTNAQVKTMFQPVSALLNSIFYRTSDSGQVNWATYTTTANTYEVFAFGDPPANNAPLVMRVDYIATAPGNFAFSIGTGTNGAGTLIAGGVLLPQTLLDSTGRTASQVTRYWYGSGDGSYFTLQMNLQATATSNATQPDSMGAIVIERTRDADGTPNSNGFCVWQWQATADNLSTAANGSYQGFRGRYYGDATTAQPAVSYDYGAQLPNLVNNASFAASNATYIFPTLTQVGPVLGGASKALALAYAADVPKQTAFTATHYGANSQWVAMGNATYATVPYMSGAATTAVKGTLTPVFRWE